MSKKELNPDDKRVTTIERVVTYKSTRTRKGSHVILPYFLSGRTIRIDFPDDTQKMYVARDAGNGSHVYVPSMYMGKVVRISYVDH